MTVHDLYINGSWVTTSNHFPNINPSDTTDVVGYFASGEGAHLDDAITSAARAYDSWRTASPQLRASLLDRVAQLILNDVDSLALLLAREEGKTIAEAEAEVTRAAHIFRFFSGEALRVRGERQASIREGVIVEVHREPVGVVGVITPWNFPIAIPAWKLAPALAYGNTVVFKPAQLVPGSAHALARIIHRAGFPPGVFNLIMGPGAVLGPLLSHHDGIDALTFTGSETVGKQIAVAAIARLAPVQLELGGKNPLIVLADADIDNAVNCAVEGAFFSTGQRCTASSRMIVEEAIHDEFVDRVLSRLDNLTVGHALDVETDIGPVVDSAQLMTDKSYIELAHSTSGISVHGGTEVKRKTKGYFLSPALFVGCDNSERICREEIFGPVASVIRAVDFDHAVELANDTEFGLVGGICTTSLARAEHYKSSANTGMVMVNVPTAGVDPHVPFGGRKGSSYGPPEQGSYAQYFYTQTKTAYIRP